MAKIFIAKSFYLFISILSLIYCTYDIKELNLNEVKYGTLTKGEFDYYKITLPDNVDKSGQIVFELEPNTVLDNINNIVSDPNLYISVNEQHPSDTKNTWASNRFGEETITLGPQYINPHQYFHIGVECREPCNYKIKVSIAKSIALITNKINSFTINENQVMKFSFTTKKEFNELNVNIVGSYLKSFNVYMANKEPSSSNSLPAEPILFNGYRFNIKNNVLQKGSNSEVGYELIVDNREEKQDLFIWLKYDNEDIQIKEAEVVYDSISESTASCFYYSIKKMNHNKDIIFSTTLFNGLGFLYINGFSPVDRNSFGASYKNKDNSYSVIQNKAIRLTQNEFKNYGKYNDDEDTFLHFCFYAEKSTSLSIKIYLMENYKNLQKLNEIYPGIKMEDILSKGSLNRYRLEHFDIKNDLSVTLTEKTGKAKLYLFMIPPNKNDILYDLSNFESYKKSDLVFEAQKYFNGYYIYLTKEQNRCAKEASYSQKNCYLSAIAVCESGEDCTYEIFFDHAKNEVEMEPRQTYSNVISENEKDSYSITIKDPKVRNIAIVLTQNSGKTVLKFNSFTRNGVNIKLTDEFKNNEFMPGIIKISAKKLSAESLIGTINLNVEGLSFASYSLYYYSYNEEEKIDYLDHEKVSMKLEKGMIIKDIFMDNHIFKVYMYDSSTNGNKTDLTVVLVETDDVNSELYIFKDLNDFTFSNGRINGYLWRGEYKDYVYIDKKDKKYLENDILYIMIYKKTKSKTNNDFTTFYLGITDETTPFLLNEAVEFKMQLTKEHNSQKFFYYFRDDGQDLQISFSLFYGHIFVKVKIDQSMFVAQSVIEDNALIIVPMRNIYRVCQDKLKCPINIEVFNDNDYLSYSAFLIAARNTKNLPVVLKQGIVNKKTILSGEEHHFIADIKPNKNFPSKITAFFNNGQGEIYARRVLNSELYNSTNFPNSLNYEYMATYKDSKKGFYTINIPYEEEKSKPFRMLITVRGIFPGFYATKIEYSLSVSGTLNELVTDKNYRLFISKGEIQHFHFRVGTEKKRLYISMTNKEKDANLYLNYDEYISSLPDSQWKNVGAYNEYLDINVEDAFFISHSMKDIDGDYYLAIQGLDDSFYNLYISTQDVKILTLSKGNPAGCTCETENDNCYFRYENINSPDIRDVFEQNLIFYTEYTYGTGELFGKLYPNGNMEDIINNLPSETNHDYIGDGSNEFLFVNLDKKNQKYTFSSVIVVGVQCKKKSLFDLSAIPLDKTTDATRMDKKVIFLKLNQDNVFYLSKSAGRVSKFIYYISKGQNFNFQIKGLLGKAKIHTYTNDTSTYYKFADDENRERTNFKNYRHISDFTIDVNVEDEKDHYGTVGKEYGKGNYLYIEVIPVEDCLINIIVNYDEDMTYIPLNKEIIGIVNSYNYFAYFDFMQDSEFIFITITAVDTTKQFNVYLKKNLINKKSLNSQTTLSKPNSVNYDIKGTTNKLTSAISFRIKNVPREVRESFVVRLLINVESVTYSYNQKVNILISPVINNINNLRPRQNTYYFTGFEKKNSDKTLYTLKSRSIDDNLMIIEMSACKGSFVYALVDSIPKDYEAYTDLTKRSVKSNIYSSNGKKIITVRDIEPKKEYYLLVYGTNNPFWIDFINSQTKKERNNDDDKNKVKNEFESEVEILFYYFTTNQKNYKYLVSQDTLNYESIQDSFGLNIFIPQLRRRDTFGRENYLDSMNYTFIVSEKLIDYAYMESTCYLTKLIQNKNHDHDYITTNLNKETNTMTVEGLIAGKTYYMNILTTNELSGEVITYKPIVFATSLKERRLKIIGIFFLTLVLLLFTIFAYYICRKYKIEKTKLSSLDIEKTSDGPFKSKNINLNVIKKNYNTLSEDSESINA